MHSDEKSIAFSLLYFFFKDKLLYKLCDLAWIQPRLPVLDIFFPEPQPDARIQKASVPDNKLLLQRLLTPRKDTVPLAAVNIIHKHIVRLILRRYLRKAYHLQSVVIMLEIIKKLLPLFFRLHQ